jgi:hypothetical protein
MQSSPCFAVGILAVWAALAGGAEAAADAQREGTTVAGRTATPAAWRDTRSDAWVASDGLGRRLPEYAEVGPLRPERTVGIFYFLWLGAHEQHGPKDVSKILAQDPEAMQRPESPLWGPLHAAHHWGEPLFGYYRSDDRYVLRRHAQMLTDAGVDMVVFDVTNQLTYKEYYMALLDEWAAVRRLGGRTPQVAFLCPFWDPRKVVPELYRDLYEPGLHSDLWFRWQGKPLILADPVSLGQVRDLARTDVPAQLVPGQTLGQSLTLGEPFVAVSGCFPTYHSEGSALTLSLYRGGPAGPCVVRQRFENVLDNSWLELVCASAQEPGVYYLEAADPHGQVGWWGTEQDALPGGQAYADGKPVPGDRSIGHRSADPSMASMLSFFTFRTPQASYFAGPLRPDMWSWLEVYPQHLFRNAAGEPEMMAVGVAQNAVGDRLGCLSEAGARGRSFRQGSGDRSHEPGAVNYGWNFQEQFQRALAEDPWLLFVTGWNEWIAGRFNEFAGVRLPVMFVDQFDQEHSRDIEPMRGGHWDHYYYLLAAAVRRYKGVRPPPPASAAKTIDPDGDWAQWNDVQPEYLDDLGDAARRDHPGYNRHCQYTNDTGRNDLARMRVARDAANLYFYAETRDDLTPGSGAHWMELFLDTDGRRDTGWEGYDLVANRLVRTATTSTLQRWSGIAWEPVADLRLRYEGKQLMLVVPRRVLGLADSAAVRVDFKWADHIQADDVMEFTVNGDAAPNGRFSYRYEGL